MSERGEGRTFPCDGCGADLVFDPGVQKMHCPYCGDTQELPEERHPVSEQDLPAMLRSLRERREREQEPQSGDEAREVACDGCGARVTFRGTLTTSDCSYCGARLQLDKAHVAERRVPVDGVLPFGVGRDDARARVKRWVKRLWFAPNAFLRKGAEGKFEGVYLPFWTFDADTDSDYTGERGEHYWVTVGSGKNRRRVRRTRWYPASGSFEHVFNDVLVAASRGIDGKRLDRLSPWPLGTCRPFSQELLAGFLSRTYDVELEDGFGVAQKRMRDALYARAAALIGGDAQRVHSVDTTYSDLTYKHLLLPVWMMAYRFRDKVYQVLVNARTGEVQGARPYSWVKITLAVAGVIVAAVAYRWLRTPG